MSHVGMFDEGHSSSTVIRLSNDCKRTFKEASFTPWCHAMIHLEGKCRIFQRVLITSIRAFFRYIDHGLFVLRTG